MRGPKPVIRPSRAAEVPGVALPRCPPHLTEVARSEWRRLAKPMHDAGVLTIADRAALAAYCQAWSRWVEAEEKLQETPMLLKTPSGYVQQSPWLSISNKQLEIMGRFMAELGLTPVARTRLASRDEASGSERSMPFVRVVLAPLDAAADRPGTDDTSRELASSGRDIMGRRRPDAIRTIQIGHHVKDL